MLLRKVLELPSFALEFQSRPAISPRVDPEYVHVGRRVVSRQHLAMPLLCKSVVASGREAFFQWPVRLPCLMTPIACFPGCSAFGFGTSKCVGFQVEGPSLGDLRVAEACFSMFSVLVHTMRANTGRHATCGGKAMDHSVCQSPDRASLMGCYSVGYTGFARGASCDIPPNVLWH